MSGSPLITSFKKDELSTAYGCGMSHFFTPKLNIGLQVHSIYNLNSKFKVYGYESSLGISTAYTIFNGTGSSFWNGGSFELVAELGGGASNFNDDVMFFFGDLSLRAYINNLAFVGIGYNHKRYDKEADNDNKNSLYLSFGFRF